MTKLLLVGGLLVGVPLGLYQGYLALMQSDYFVISAIYVEGNERLERDAILRIARLDGRRNIFAVDADVIAERLVQNPWVTDAEVELDLPRTVRIRIAEREQAGWLWCDQLLRVDTDGFVIERGSALELDGPMITGIEPTTRAEMARDELADRRRYSAERVRTALAIAGTYRENELEAIDALAEVHFDELLGYSLLTRQHALEVRLGHDRFEERLNRLTEVLRTLEGRELGGRYVLLDGEGSLSRVAVGPARPGRGGAGPVTQDASLLQ